MRIVIWNMAHAFRTGLDIDPWIVLADLDPDVALLQETRTAPVALGGNFHLVPTKKGWGTAVWAKHPFSWTGTFPASSGVSTPALEKALAGYVSSAVMEPRPGQSISFTSVHAYPERVGPGYLVDIDVALVKTPGTKDVWPGDLIWHATRQLPISGDSAVLGGDWNTSLLLDKVYGPRGNAEFFDRMRDTGWCDALKKFQADEIQTYFKAGKHPYQLDHAFLTPDLFARLRSAEVTATTQALGASDHAPIVIEVDT